jgi:hypothetical protein
MPTLEEYEARIRAMGWQELRELWSQVKVRETRDWQPGKAFEYLVLRAFDLDGAEVRWPYPVSLHGQDEVIEQIDGSVRFGGLYGLVESKDETGNIAIAPIAKLRNQLMRRPAGTIGVVFSSQGYTEAALQLAQFALPQAILLWTGNQIEFALNNERICDLCERKYRACVDYGMVDFDISLGGIT